MYLVENRDSAINSKHLRSCILYALNNDHDRGNKDTRNKNYLSKKGSLVVGFKKSDVFNWMTGCVFLGMQSISIPDEKVHFEKNVINGINESTLGDAVLEC